MRSGRAIVLSDYIGGDSGNTGGAGHAALASYRALDELGVDVRAIACFGGFPAANTGRFQSLGGGDLREAGGAGALRAIYNPAAAAALNAALAGEDRASTIVILHQWTRYLSPAAMRALAGFAVMVYMHDYFWACPNGLYYDFGERRPCTRRPLGLDCLAADCERHGRVQKAGRVVRSAVLERTKPEPAQGRLCLHLSEGARATAAPLLPREHHAVLHNPTALPVAPPSPAAAPCFDLGYFGRLEPEKGVGLLMEAVARSDLSALMVGQGMLEPAVAAAPGLEHRVWQPRETIAAAMRDCRVIVLPSLWHETWGLVVPEAMAAGVPVLVSVRAGSAELVRKFGGGALFDPGVPGDLTAKLRALLAGESETAVHDWAGLRAFLSAGRHAARIADLAAETWNIDLRPRGRVSAAQPAAIAARPA